MHWLPIEYWNGSPLWDVQQSIEEAPHHQHDDGADHGADQAGALTRVIPAERLAEIGRNEGAGDAERRGDERCKAWPLLRSSPRKRGSSSDSTQHNSPFALMHVSAGPPL